MDKKLEKYLKPNLKEARMRKSDIEYKEFILDENIKVWVKERNIESKHMVVRLMKLIQNSRWYFRKDRFTLAEDEVDADLILLNTCAIRETLKIEFGAIRQIKNL